MALIIEVGRKWRTSISSTPLKTAVNITVILCTYNRCEILSKALDSVACSVLPNSVGWEVLVVDNNSRDRTRDVVSDFSRRYPGRFRYLFEAQQGKSHALNSGIREAHGDVVAFVDDDVTVDPLWLKNLTSALGSGDCAGAGGRILPAQPFSLPSWLAISGSYEMGAAVAALFDLGERPVQLDNPPYGTNMAFRKEMFEKHGFFAVNLGPRPGSQIRGEDTELGRRLIAAGERLRYEPTAIVYHPVFESRARKDYLLAWWFDHGRALMREKVWKRDVLGIPRHYFCIVKTAVTQLSVRALRWVIALNPKRRFYWKCQSWRMAGEIFESYCLASDLKSQVVAPMQETETGDVQS